MKSTSLPPKSDLAHLDTASRITRMSSRGLSLRVAAVLILAGLLLSSFHWGSAASTSKKTYLRQNLAAGTKRPNLSKQSGPKKEATPDLKELFIKSGGY